MQRGASVLPWTQSQKQRNGENRPCCQEHLLPRGLCTYVSTLQTRCPPLALPSRGLPEWQQFPSRWSVPSSRGSNLCKLLWNCAGTKPAEGAGVWDLPFLRAFGSDVGSSMFFCCSQLSPFASACQPCACAEIK